MGSEMCIRDSSLYLARDKDYVLQNFYSLIEANKRFHEAVFDGNASQVTTWQDILYEYLAFADPADAAERYQANEADIKIEFGETKVHTTQWIAALERLGHFDAKVGADWPTAVCFVKEGQRTYVAYNACLLYTSPSPRDLSTSRMPSSA